MYQYINLHSRVQGWPVQPEMDLSRAEPYHAVEMRLSTHKLWVWYCKNFCDVPTQLSAFQEWASILKHSIHVS